MSRIKFINKIYIYLLDYIRFLNLSILFKMILERKFYFRNVKYYFHSINPVAYFRIILQTRVESNSVVNSEQSIMEINSPIGRRALPPGNNRPIFPKQNLYTKRFTIRAGT